MKEHLTAYHRIKKFKTYCNSYLTIKDKRGEIIPFLFNSAQKKIDEIFERVKAEGKPLRFIILKARQEGVSTYFEGRIFHKTSTDFNIKSSIIGHEQESADNLFDMFNRFYNNLPEAIKPIQKYSNRKELSFAKLGGEITISSADSGEKLKRSDTIQMLHATEVAFWRDAKNAMLALLQTVPDEQNTLIVIESTANGIGGWFYDTWQSAKRGENDFIPIFLGWWELPEYSREFENEKEKTRFVNSLSNYDLDLKSNYNLTYEQLHWYKYILINKCNGDEDLMKQEYPCSPEEAFITSGRPVFDSIICFENLRYAELLEKEGTQPKHIGNLYPRYDGSQKYLSLVAEGRTSYYDLLKHIVRVDFVEEKEGYIKLFENKEEIKSLLYEKNRFASGSDVAEGLEQGDYSAIKVLDRKTNKVCLTWHGHIDPDLFGVEHHKLQIFLGGKVYFGIERNNHGLSTIYSAQRLGVNLYYAQDFRKGWVIESDLLGFRTTQSTRIMALNELASWIREKRFTDYEKEYWSEALTFVKNSKGKMQAQNKDINPGTKCFDDRIIAAMIMIQVHLWMPTYQHVVEELSPKWVKELKQNIPKRNFMEL